MSYHKNFEDPLAQDVASNGTSTLHDRDVVDFQGRRMFAFFGNGAMAVLKGLKHGLALARSPEANGPDNHRRRLVSPGPTGGYTAPGYF